jgi:hypothetical protein
MPASKGGLSNRLLGQKIRPSSQLLAQQELLARLWKLKPNLSNEYFATVEAVWASDNHVKVLAKGPMGDIAEIYLHEGLIEIGEPARGMTERFGSAR